MVRIAICDDEKEAVVLHEKIIKDSLQSCGIGYEITTYTYSSNLLADIAEDGFFYDLLLLDILESICLTSDRVLVLEQGQIKKCFAGQEIEAEKIREVLKE